MKNADLIDRDRLLKYIDSMSIEDTSNNLVFKTANTILSMFKQVVEAMPNADTERHGYWNLKRATTGTQIFKCSSCGHERFIPYGAHLLPDFCEKCGCKMDKVVDDE